MNKESSSYPRGPRHARHAFNVGDAERVGSLAVGALLAIQGLRRRSPLGAVAAGAGALLMTRGVTGHSYVYERLGIDRTHAPVSMRTALTINRPVEQVYGYWRDLTNLPLFMRHLRSVAVLDERRSHWVAQPPFGAPALEWDAEIVDERANELLRWRSLPDARIENHGTVRFRRAPNGRGTELHVELLYRPPAGTALARLMAPMTAQMLKEEIRRLKHLLETGEIPTTEGQPSARLRRAA